MARVDDLRIDAPPARPHRRGPTATPWLLLLALGLFIWWMAGRPLPQFLQPAAAPAGSGAVQSGGPSGGVADGSADAITPASMAAPGPPGSFSAGGYVEVVPPGPVAVSSTVAAKVAQLHVIPGDKVEQGQLVAELDSSLLRKHAAVLQARVDVAASQLALTKAGFRDQELLDAQAGVDRARARLSRAEADASRAEQLFQAGVAPRADYDAALSELAQAQAELASAEALLDLRRSGPRREEVGISESGVKLARAELARVNYEIAQCLLRAPLGGVVYDIHAAEGAWVDPQDNSDHPGSVLSIFDPHALQAFADVNQRDSSRVRIGQAVELTTDAFPQEPIAGVVERIMPQANLQRNTVRVIIAIPEPPDYLKPEMNLKVSFLADDSGATVPGRDSTDAGRNARAIGDEEAAP